MPRSKSRLRKNIKTTIGGSATVLGVGAAVALGPAAAWACPPGTSSGSTTTHHQAEVSAGLHTQGQVHASASHSASTRSTANRSDAVSDTDESRASASSAASTSIPPVHAHSAHSTVSAGSTEQSGSVREDQREATPAQTHEQESSAPSTPSSTVRPSDYRGASVGTTVPTSITTVAGGAHLMAAGHIRSLLLAMVGGDNGRINATLQSPGVLMEIERAIESGGVVTITANGGTVTVLVSGAPNTGQTTTETSLPGSVSGQLQEEQSESSTAQQTEREGTTAQTAGLSASVLAAIRSALEAGLPVELRITNGVVSVIPASASTGTTGTAGSTGTSSVPGTSATAGTTATVSAGHALTSSIVSARPSAGRGTLTASLRGSGALTGGAGLTSAGTGLSSRSGTALQTAAVTGASGSRGSTLAFTGSETEREAVLAAILAGFGGVLTFVARRGIRRPAGSHYTGS